MSCLQRMHLLDEIEARLVTPFVPPTLSGRPLAEVRRAMLDPTVDVEVKDSAWREVLENARRQGADWQLAALWMMLPGLRGIVARSSGGPGIDSRDLESEAVTG